METLDSVIQLGFILFIFVIPIIAVMKSDGLLRANIVSIPLIWLLVTAFAYWPHLFTDFKLALMGFDFEGTYSAERLRNVPLELHDEAMRLYWSDVGIGWSAKAIIGCILLAPYPTLVWATNKLIKHIKSKWYN